MSHLVLKDNIRASAACKTWREVALSVRVVEKHPWLLCFCKPGGSLIKLHDPLKCKTYALDLPELDNSTVCYSRDGWLLMHRLSSNDLFFFNPFSKELINLPKLEFPFVEIAFSSPPTSDHPRATEWNTEEFPDYLRPFIMHSELVYLSDRFCCFNAGGSCLYSFHVSSRKWYLYDAKYICHQQQWKWEEKLVFLAEKKGELFLMFTCGKEKPILYKLGNNGGIVMLVTGENVVICNQWLSRWC